ncbi:MAG: phosphoribosylaminoimidazolesuccinocarboxamide synthase [Planctomycetota bacterium]
MAQDGILETDVPGFNLKRGKVRDVYDLGNRILLVVTDRISAFDCILPNAIPHKGRVLAAMSKFWFDRFSDTCPHHLVSIVNRDVPTGFESVSEQLRGRAMLCRKVNIVPIECVARGYLAGSGWAEYQANGTVCGIPLPGGLKHCSRLPQPIFTPATKAESGHDENISFEMAGELVGQDVIRRLRDMTLTLYSQASEYARGQGIIVADTKFEFGWLEDRLVLADEALTPDSSRFWPADAYEPGRDQESFDKQFVRNHLQRLCDRGQWDKTPPAPNLPNDVVQATSERYLEAYRRVTGHTLTT